jgi:hypothetical protein
MSTTIELWHKLEGVKYYGQLQSDSKTYLIKLPFGSDLRSVKIDFLPAHRRVVPSLGQPWDFSEGPLDFTLVAQDNITRRAVKIKVVTLPQVVKSGTLVSPDGKDWALNGIEQKDHSYSATVSAPISPEATLPEGTLLEGTLSEGTAVQELPSLHVTLRGLSNLSLDLTGYAEGSNAPDGSKKDRRLRIYGTAKNLATLESLSVEEIDFTYASEPGVTYRQTFIPPVAYDAIGEKHLAHLPEPEPPAPIPDDENEDKIIVQEGGCNAGFNRGLSAAFLFALFALFVLLGGGRLSLRGGRKS